MSGGPNDGAARVTGDAELSYERRGPAAWITLNRPGQRNALTATMLAQAHRALDLAEADDQVRVLVLTGAGPAFSPAPTCASSGPCWPSRTAATASWPP